ncbi:MAG: hypothetical protein FJX78_02005 [Armatimonadetes bacterium]|nr:hypothetical protein [Armatimonadota bacterium]
MMPAPDVLVVSNGYGEDAMGNVLAQALRARGAAVRAFPIVGLGHGYEPATPAIPMLNPRRALPTAGFGFRTGWREALRDLVAGWSRLTLEQRAAVRQASPPPDYVLAIGDVFCLWVAAAAGQRPVYLPTAKSEYNEPLFTYERALIRRMASCSWPRDVRTARRYRELGLAASFYGNLMMDCLTYRGLDVAVPEGAPVVLLLPGSRLDAPDNFRRMTSAVRIVLAARPDVRVLAAVSSTVEPDALAAAAGVPIAADVMTLPAGEVRVTRRFADAARRATVVIGMAGTASEQAAGLGKPIVAFPGAGPQFTPRFLALQARLLGDALVATATPAEGASAVLRLLDDPAARLRRGAVGQSRMGRPGAANAMAERLVAAWASDQAGIEPRSQERSILT